MSGTTMMNETPLLLILAVIVFLSLSLSRVTKAKERANRLIKRVSHGNPMITHIISLGIEHVKNIINGDIEKLA